MIFIQKRQEQLKNKGIKNYTDANCEENEQIVIPNLAENSHQQEFY